MDSRYPRLPFHVLAPVQRLPSDSLPSLLRFMASAMTLFGVRVAGGHCASAETLEGGHNRLEGGREGGGTQSGSVG